MINLIVLSLYALCILALIYYSYIAIKTRRSVSLHVSNVLISTLFCTVTYYILLLSPKFNIATYLLSFYYMGFTWILFSLLALSIKITDFHEKPIAKLIRIPIGVLCVFDSLSLSLNPTFHHLFYIGRARIFGRELYINTYASKLFIYHYYLCYIIIIILMVMLLYRLFTTSKIYHARYLTLVIGVLALIGINLYIAFSGSVFNFMTLCNALYAILIYHLVLIRAPRSFYEQFLDMYIERSGSGILLIDVEGRCIYANKAIMDMTNTHDMANEEIHRHVDEFLTENGINPSTDESQNFMCTVKDRTLYYNFERTTLTDSKGILVGYTYNINDNTSRFEELLKKQYENTHDPLTGLYNNVYFYQKVKERISQGLDEPYIIICADIDDFKFINDIYGIDTGNEVLKAIAKDITEKHSPSKDMVFARIEGDAFAFFIPKSLFSESIYDFNSIKYFPKNSMRFFPVILKIGIYEITDPDMDVRIMIDHAFLAIRSIKHSFKTRVAWYKESLRSDVIRNRRLTQSLKDSIENEDFVLYLQPQMDKDGSLHGAEALVRWKHPTEGFIPPDEFIPLLEHSGQIIDVDKYVWEHACMILSRWKDKGIDIPISINISPVDFYYVDICEHISNLVKRYDIEPQKLHLEITESAIISTHEKNGNFLERLHEAGFIVEMDDFGSGYSSLNTLKNLDVDLLKLDMKFLSDSSSPERSKTILESIVALSKNLNMPAIAEGVEETSQLEMLKSIGVDIFQGYHFSKPVSIGDFEEKYIRND